MMLGKGIQSNRKIIILALPPVRELDLAGIVEVFGTANSFLPPERHYQIEVVTPTPSRHVDGMFGLKFLCDRAYRDIKGKIDTLLIPSGLGAEAFAPSRALLQWVRQWEGNSRRIGSICTGCFLLAKTGILDGRRVTTHWEYAKRLALRFPTLKVDFDPIWIRDENVYSSAGVTSGMTEDLKKIDVPTLILLGDDDQIVPVAATSLLTAKLLPKATFKIYPGAPHGMCTTLKDQVNADLLSFITES